MALWGNTDAQSNAPLIVVRTDGDVATSNTARLGTTQYGNSVFAVDAAEMKAGGGKRLAHAGWVVKRDRGNGRVQYETLVAMGSIQGDGADDAVFPDYALSFTTQPADLVVATGGSASFTVVAASAPVGATIGYVWQANTGAGFVDLVANTEVTGVDAATLVIDPVETLGNAQVRVVISATGAANVTSSVAGLTVTV